jgi:hypothetical protein
MAFGEAGEGLEDEAKDHQRGTEPGQDYDAARGFLLLIFQREVGVSFVEFLIDAIGGQVAEAAEGLFGEDEGSDKGDGISGEAEAETVGD